VQVRLVARDQSLVSPAVSVCCRQRDRAHRVVEPRSHVRAPKRRRDRVARQVHDLRSRKRVDEKRQHEHRLGQLQSPERCRVRARSLQHLLRFASQPPPVARARRQLARGTVFDGEAIDEAHPLGRIARLVGLAADEDARVLGERGEKPRARTAAPGKDHRRVKRMEKRAGHGGLCAAREYFGLPADGQPSAQCADDRSHRPSV